MTTKKSYSILVVEDEPQLQRALVDKIRREGWEAISAINGEEGLKHIEDKKPDLVLLDLRMPKMDGFTMLRKVRETYNNADLPVMVLTNYDKSENVDEALELGVEVFLVKANYSLDDIADKVREILSDKK